MSKPKNSSDNKQALIGLAILIGVAVIVFIAKPKSAEEIVRANFEKQGARVLSGNAPAALSGSSVELDVPDFEVQTTNGESFTLSSLVAKKPTIVGFWASWCHNCQRNLPIQNELFKKYKDQVNIIEVNMSENRSAVDKYALTKNYDFHMAYDEKGLITKAFGVNYTNTKYLIGADGKLITAFSGDVEESHFLQLLETT